MLRNLLVVEWVVVSVLGMLIAGGAAWSGIASKLDNLLLDVAMPLRVAPIDDRILIVEIDNESLAKLGNFPWPRRTHAQFLDRVKRAGPRVIAYDILFLEPTNAIDDAALATAVGRGAPTLLPVLYQVPGTNGATEDITLPIDPLPDVAAGLGEVNLLFDSDGLVRRPQLQTNAAGQTVPHLMELVYRIVTARPSPAHTRARQRTEADEGLYLPMAPVGSFRHISYAAVLSGELPAQFLKDRVILVGATADGMGDRYSVSAMAGSSMAGIEIQANLLNALFADRFVRPLPLNLATVLSVAPVILLMLLFWRFRPAAGLPLALAMIALVIVAAFAMLAIGGLWFAPVSALTGIMVVYPLWSWRRLATVSRFMTKQVDFLRSEKDGVFSPSPATVRLDHVGRDAAELERMIGDATDRKRFVTDIIAAVPDAICVLDDSGIILLANAAARDFFGDSVEGSPMTHILADAGIGTIGDGDEAILTNGRSIQMRKADFADRSGSVMIFADTTAIRALGREREEMLEFLSHDMRAPQSAILMLLADTAALDGPAQARIAENAKKTLKLADSFVQLARLKNVDFVMADVDIAAIVTEAVDACWPQARAQRIKIRTDGLESEAFIRGDADTLVRAISNLVDNAIKYSPHGSDIRCVVAPNHEHVTVTISDDGPGLPPERASDIFARFGDRGGTAIGGSGLGLAFVHMVIQRHNGEISCRNTLGAGACFTLRFALANPI